jgi:molecular chaperone DnaK
MPQIEVTFDIDANGIVNVSAKDKATNKEQAIRIQASGGLSDDEINKMVKDAEANAEADKKKKELVEAKNHAEGLIHEVEKNLKEHGDKIAESDKSAINSALEAAKASIETENLEDIKSKTDALMQASMKLGEAMYKSQQAQGGAQGPEQGADTGATEAPKDDNVVDADYEEVK